MNTNSDVGLFFLFSDFIFVFIFLSTIKMDRKETVTDEEIQNLQEQLKKATLEKDNAILLHRKLKSELKKAEKEKFKQSLPPKDDVKKFEKKVKRSKVEKRKEEKEMGIKDESPLPDKRVKIDDVPDVNDNNQYLYDLSREMEKLSLKQDKDVEKSKLIFGEMDEIIEKYKDRPNPPTRYEAILLKEPNDEREFLECLNKDRKKRDEGVVIANYQTYSNYWTNFITSMDDVNKFLDDVINLEKKRTRIKISTTFGLIYETFETDPETNETRYSYQVYNPNDVDEVN
jgi:hypothetical protein